jgi:hypothetical protein
VVTAEAIVMISAFSGFILMDDPIIKSMGFALAAGVAIDAFVVRMTIAPAVMSLLGDKAWWLPRWLDRALPKVAVEGDGLRTRLRETCGQRSRQTPDVNEGPQLTLVLCSGPFLTLRRPPDTSRCTSSAQRSTKVPFCLFAGAAQGEGGKDLVHAVKDRPHPDERDKRHQRPLP